MTKFCFLKTYIISQWEKLMSIKWMMAEFHFNATLSGILLLFLAGSLPWLTETLKKKELLLLRTQLFLSESLLSYANKEIHNIDFYFNIFLLWKMDFVTFHSWIMLICFNCGENELCWVPLLFCTPQLYYVILLYYYTVYYVILYRSLPNGQKVE